MPRSSHRPCLASRSREADLKMEIWCKWGVSYHDWIKTSHDAQQWWNEDKSCSYLCHFIANSTVSLAASPHWLFHCSQGHINILIMVSHYKSNPPYCLASMQIQPCWLMLAVVSARMLMLWQVCSMLNRKKTGIAAKANTASQMKAKMYVTMINCWNKKVTDLWFKCSGVSVINMLSLKR